MSNERKLRRITSTLGEGVFVIDSDGRFTFANPEAERLLGWSESEILGKRAHEILCCEIGGRGAEGDDACPLMGVIRSGRPYRSEDGAFLRKDEKPLPVAFVSTPIEEGGEIVGSVTAFRDITDRKMAEETIKRMAYYDPLTGLPNRTLFSDRLGVAIARAHRNGEQLSVMFIDLDNFKTINDSLGHAMGDELLKAVAGRLKGLVREGDTVARLGGDEFTLLLPGVIHPEDAVKVAEKILNGLEPPFRVSGRELHITGSIGITVYPQDGETAEALLKNADIAMYRAKEKGRNNYQVFSPAMNAAAFERLALESGLRKAIDADEFEVHYQPQVDVFSGKIVGLEALVRWRHPEQGLILPQEFVPLAEETGLIVQIGRIVLREACSRAREWRDMGLSFAKLAVNISAKQFASKNLPREISEILDEVDLDPADLEIEITESVAMKNARRTSRILKELKDMGVKVAIDDFGTGYSSLSYLKRFPIDTLKIDRSFVKDIARDQDSAVIISTILALGQNLKLDVVAEGVDSEEQLYILKSKGCRYAQGYLFSLPLPADEVPKLLRDNRKLAVN